MVSDDDVRLRIGDQCFLGTAAGGMMGTVTARVIIREMGVTDEGLIIPEVYYLQVRWGDGNQGTHQPHELIGVAEAEQLFEEEWSSYEIEEDDDDESDQPY